MRTTGGGIDTNYALNFTFYFTNPAAKISLHFLAQLIIEIGSCCLHNLSRVLLVCLLLCAVD